MRKKETSTAPAWDDLRPGVTDALLADVTRRVVERFDPHRIVLFGSYAYGEPDRNSDVDLLIIMDSDEPMARRIARVAEVAEVRFLPMDVLVYTPEEIEARIAKGDFFIAEVVTKGKVLYERDATR